MVSKLRACGGGAENGQVPSLAPHSLPASPTALWPGAAGQTLPSPSPSPFSFPADGPLKVPILCA
jgi:hypothetical protein